MTFEAYIDMDMEGHAMYSVGTQLDIIWYDVLSILKYQYITSQDTILK